MTINLGVGAVYKILLPQALFYLHSEQDNSKV